MKKFILASAFALMATPALLAQSNNTYSMQIELKDGTKITLGPNDLKNITFVDGVIKIEGNTIEELRSSIAKCEATTQVMTEEQSKNIDALKAKASDLQAMIDYLSVKVAQLEKSEGGTDNTEDIKTLQSAISTLEKELVSLKTSQTAMKTDLAASNDKITNVQMMVTATEVAIKNLQEAVKSLQSSGDGSAANEERIKALEAEITVLKASQADMKAALVNLKNESAQNKVMISDVASVVNATNGKVQDLGEIAASLSDNVKASQAAIDQLKVESKNAQTDLKKLNENLLQSIEQLKQHTIPQEVAMQMEDGKAMLQSEIEKNYEETKGWIQALDARVANVENAIEEIFEKLVNLENNVNKNQ